MNSSEVKVLNQIAGRAHVIMNQMIHNANFRRDSEKGDPKVGGHPSASASALHILGALHLVVKSGYDGVVNKPHASPVDHAYNYLLNLFLDQDLKPLSLEHKKQALNHFRAYPKPGGYAFQSYHSVYDPDHHNFLPSGTVGIPPVVLGYLALAYRLAALQGYEVPAAHFWAVMGDSEFREGSLMEALPDLAEREVGNLTWIVDYNRQSLDGHRLVNEDLIQGCDSLRIEKTLQANGWEVIQLKHGSFRKQLFQKPEGKNFKHFLEKDLKDIEFQNLLLKEEEELKSFLLQNKNLKKFVSSLSAKDLKQAIWDLGGHDFSSLISALRESKKNKKKPCLIIAHTIKGWGLKMAGVAGNHSALVSSKEIKTLEGSSGAEDFALFEKGSAEDIFLKKREAVLYQEILSQHQIKKKNLLLREALFKDMPQSFGVDFQRMSYPHTQWFLGQVTAKMARLASSPPNKNGEHKGLKACADLVFTMSPDVGTSTNLGACMHHRVFGPEFNKERFSDLEDPKSPVLWTESHKNNRFLRFEIAEANSVSCMAALGKVGDILGVLLLPVLTVYDFFIKRALDQFFYALYLRSGFILCGTPSGVSLSSEGAQHCWKSDFQIPGQVSWEPFFLQEMDWVLADAFRRHFTQNNKDRSGVLVRATTKGVDQKLFIKCLKTQKKFKRDKNVLLCPEGYSLKGAKEESTQATVPEGEILTCVRKDVLKGAYYLLHYTGYADYMEGDNVVHVLAMGATGAGAVQASRALLSQGIYANVIMVTSPDLLLGNLAYKDEYRHLKHGLALGVGGGKVPLVSVHDGEPGLLDNAGSVLAVHQECLSVRKHSLCGSLKNIYAYHGIDKESIVKACLKVLKKTVCIQDAF